MRGKPLRNSFKSHSHKRLTFAFTLGIGYTLVLTHKSAHSGSHGETGGVSDGECYHYSRRALRGLEPLRAQRSEEHTLPSLHGPRERRREAESLRNGDAHRARLRSEGAAVSRGRAAPLLALSYTGKLRSLSSLRRRAERKLLTGLLCFRLWCGSLLWRRGFFFSYSGAFLEPMFASIHARNLSFGTTIRLPILSAGKLLLRASS